MIEIHIKTPKLKLVNTVSRAMLSLHHTSYSSSIVSTMSDLRLYFSLIRPRIITAFFSHNTPVAITFEYVLLNTVALSRTPLLSEMVKNAILLPFLSICSLIFSIAHAIVHASPSTACFLISLQVNHLKKLQMK